MVKMTTITPVEMRRQLQRSAPVDVSRRVVLTSVVALPWPARRAAAESLLEQAKKVEYGLKEGRIRSCPSNLNPNCISTSSIGFDSYASPWRGPLGGSLSEATEALVDVMPKACENSQLLASRTSADAAYLKFEVKGRFGPDVVEFLVRRDDAPSRGWKGDTADPLIFYRSIARDVKYIYPFIQPLSDLGLQKKRMERIRELLSWRKVGCELIECYE